MSQSSTAPNSTGLLVLNEMQKRQIKEMIQDMIQERSDNLTDEDRQIGEPIAKVSDNLEELNKVRTLSIRYESTLVNQVNQFLEEISGQDIGAF